MSTRARSSNSLSPILAHQVREPRVTRTEHWNLSVLFNESVVEIRNISDTGVAFSCPKKLEIGEEGQIQLIFAQDEKISLDGKIAWCRQDEKGYLVGLHFKDTYLPEGILQAMDRVSFLKDKLTLDMDNFSKVDPEFKKLTFEIDTYLSSSKTYLDDLENETLVSSVNIRNSHLAVVRSLFEPEFVSRLKEYSRKLDAIFTKIPDKAARKIHVDFFRHKVGVYYTENPFIARALRKPRGYSGDYEMMNQIYRNTAEGRTFFEMMMHRYGINESSSKSVQFRRGYFINKITSLSEGKEPFKIASIACGPAREVVDLMGMINKAQSAKFEICLLDQDVEALLNAKRNISEQIISRNLESSVHFLPISVKQILDRHEDTSALEQMGFDLIYTAGLYDYLTQPVAQLLTQFLLGWLKPGGDLIIGNFHPLNPTKTISELVADWKLIHRDESQMLDLVPKIGVKSTNLVKDEEGIDLFLEIKK